MNRQMLDALFMRRGIPTAHRTPGEIAALLTPGTHPDMEQYLLQLLPETTSLVSGVRLKSLEGIVEENSGAAAPGGFIFPPWLHRDRHIDRRQRGLREQDHRRVVLGGS